VRFVERGRLVTTSYFARRRRSVTGIVFYDGQIIEKVGKVNGKVVTETPIPIPVVRCETYMPSIKSPL